MQFVITTANGQYYWQVKKNNGDAIGQASNIYNTLAEAQTDIKLIKQWAASSPVVLPVNLEAMANT